MPVPDKFYDDPRERWIYESPDRGVTVYRRLLCSPDRELIHVVDARAELVDALADCRVRWYSILEDALHDEVLADMIGRVEVYHALKHQ